MKEKSAHFVRALCHPLKISLSRRLGLDHFQTHSVEGTRRKLKVARRLTLTHDDFIRNSLRRIEAGTLQVERIPFLSHLKRFPMLNIEYKKPTELLHVPMSTNVHTDTTHEFVLPFLPRTSHFKRELGNLHSLCMLCLEEPDSHPTVQFAKKLFRKNAFHVALLHKNKELLYTMLFNAFVKNILDKSIKICIL